MRTQEAIDGRGMAGEAAEKRLRGLPARKLTGYQAGLLRAKAADASWWQRLVHRFLGLLARVFYRIDARGVAARIPREGPVLLIANHTAYTDPLILLAVSPRPIRFLSAARFQGKPLMGRLLRLGGVVPVSAEAARPAIEAAAAALERGEVVCIFPEGRLTRDGTLQPLRRGFSVVARRAGAGVVPVYLDGLWGSLFSFSADKFSFNRCQSPRYPVRVRAGAALPPMTATTETATRALLDLGEEAVQARPELEGHLGAEALASLAKEPGKVLIIDHSGEREAYKGRMIGALAVSLAREVERLCPDEKRVGIILPPGVGAAIANLGVSLAGKTPVNLNFTLGRKALGACYRKAGVRKVITAEAMRQKLDERIKDFPWPAEEAIIDLPRVLKGLPKWRVALRLAAIQLLPGNWVCRLFGAPVKGDHAEAAILFTSGSVGEPKGVVLTHRNLLAQRYQIDHCQILPGDAIALANLPVFHSFGFTVTLWYGLLARVTMATAPSPLDVKKNLEVIEQEGVSVLVGTPTFLRTYYRKARPEQLRSVKWAVAGAEKTPEGFHDAWEERFPGSIYLEGYGLTETAPAVAVNLPHTPPQAPAGNAREPARAPGIERGTVGRLFVGLSARIRNQDTGEAAGLGEQGVLELKGASVFPGYLDDEAQTRAAFTEDGWFITKDLGRLDERGFLTIDGRISRFSKIGGEMVPHGSVEEAIVEAFGLEQEEEPAVAVTAREDPQKGEVLVLLTTVELDREAVRRKLSAAGFANLWIPREIRRVERIPVLPTGKLNLKEVKARAAGEGPGNG